MKRFVDDISVEVIEEQLISTLSSIFSPIAVPIMAAELVTQIAGESEESQAERERLKRQADVFKKGLETCKRFVQERTIGMIKQCGISARFVDLHATLVEVEVEADTDHETSDFGSPFGLSVASDDNLDKGIAPQPIGHVQSKSPLGGEPAGQAAPEVSLSADPWEFATVKMEKAKAKKSKFKTAKELFE